MKSSITMNASATEKIEDKVDTIETAVLQHTNCLRSRDTKNAKSVVTASKPPKDLQLYRNNQLFQCHNIPVMLTNQCLMEMFQQQITPLLNLGKMVNLRSWSER